MCKTSKNAIPLRQYLKPTATVSSGNIETTHETCQQGHQVQTSNLLETFWITMPEAVIDRTLAQSADIHTVGHDIEC